MTFKMNFNSTVIWRQFSTVSLFFLIKIVLVPWTSHVKGLYVRSKFYLSWTISFGALYLHPFRKFLHKLMCLVQWKTQCNTFHCKGLIQWWVYSYALTCINVKPGEGGRAWGGDLTLNVFAKICRQIPCPWANHFSQMHPNFPPRAAHCYQISLK